MDIIELILLSIGLAMDAFAVSVCKGLENNKVSIKESLLCGVWFGGFQGLMPFIGFILGTIYQYVLLKIMIEVVFKDIEVPAYTFNYKLFFITLGIFIVIYELLIEFYTRRLNKIPIKEIMIDSI